VQEGDATVVAAAATIDFDASDFTVTDTGGVEANISLAYGTGAGTPAEGNHAHAGVYQPLDAALTNLTTHWNPASASGASILVFHEDTDNGTNSLWLTGPQALANDDSVIVLPEGNGTLAFDAAVVHDTGDETIAGVKTFSSDPIIPDEAYGVGWNGSLEPPTKNAVYDKIETVVGSGAAALDDLSDVVISAPALGDTLYHDGTDWDNRAASQSATIASGAVTVAGPWVRLLTVDTEAVAATDDLLTINGGTAGHLLVLRATNAARTVNVVEGGNIEVQSAGGSFPLDNVLDTWAGIYTGTVWQEITRSNNGA
jgi:hypothetical protein